MNGNKFFFEEDTSEQSPTGVGFEEQADIFSSSVKEVGIATHMGSMKPMQASVPKIDLKVIEDKLVRVEYGVIDADYVIHITPIHDRRNLKPDAKLKRAIEASVIEMNKSIPFDLQVAIHLPQESWDVKVLSFVVKGGASAWNFDQDSFGRVAIPIIHKSVSDICLKP